jgi:hypothetical protein
VYLLPAKVHRGPSGMEAEIPRSIQEGRVQMGWVPGFEPKEPAVLWDKLCGCPAWGPRGLTGAWQRGGQTKAGDWAARGQGGPSRKW